jgi:Mg2+-importing ATPase
VLLLTLILPYSPLAPPLGFVPLPGWFLAAVLTIVAAYVLAAEVTKRAFYRIVQD